MSINGPAVTVCSTYREAQRAARHYCRRARIDPRKLSIVLSGEPPAGASSLLKHWNEAGVSWVTIGCLNAIGAGLDCFGIPSDGVQAYKTALNAKKILVVARH